MSETTTSPEIQQAMERMNAAYKAFQYAQDNAYKAEAELARLVLLGLVDQIPDMTGMTFETQYEYDDEGGYFRSLSCYPTVADGGELEFDQYDFIDYMNGFSPEAICVLCEVPTDTFQGQITLEQVRERRF